MRAVGGYPGFDHPLQQKIRHAVAHFTAPRRLRRFRHRWLLGAELRSVPLARLALDSRILPTGRTRIMQTRPQSC
jgi:hypothetical protein